MIRTDKRAEYHEANREKYSADDIGACIVDKSEKNRADNIGEYRAPNRGEYREDNRGEYRADNRGE